MTTIVGIDPGKTTGLVACSAPGAPYAFRREEIMGPFALWEALNSLRPCPDVVVYEGFLYRGGVSADLSGCRLEGLIEFWCGTHYTKMITQYSTVKRFWTKKILKDEFQFHDSSPHITDAFRHVVQYLTFNSKEYKLTRAGK